MAKRNSSSRFLNATVWSVVVAPCLVQGCSISQQQASMPLQVVPPVVTPTNNTNKRVHTLVAESRVDLTQRLGVTESEVETVEARLVIWPDGSVGCPHAGMQYPQMLVPGVLVRLRVAESVYSYHAGRRGGAMYCSTPTAIPPPSLYAEE